MQIFNPDSNIPFLKYGKFTVGLSVLLVIASLVLIFGKGLNYGLDFTGGVLVEVSYQKPVATPDVRKALSKAGFPSALVQSVGGDRSLVVRIQPKNMTSDEDSGKEADRIAESVLAALKSQRSDVTLKRHDFVGPQVGKQLRSDGTVAVVFVVIGILLYLGIRFERRFAIAALLAEIHDTLVTVGVIALIGREFDMTVLASVLAVVGYSVNDKVVVFDRIRELFRMSRKADPEEILNRSINQTLSRTIITSTFTAVTMIALALFGGPSVHGFAVTMLIGIIVGTLSSIFIASPLLLMFGVSKKDMMVVTKDNPELARRP